MAELFGPKGGSEVFEKVKATDRATDADKEEAVRGTPLFVGETVTIAGQREFTANFGRAVVDGDVESAQKVNTENIRRMETDGAFSRGDPEKQQAVDNFVEITDTRPFQIFSEKNVGIGDNALNDYINVQYHLIFSMIPKANMAKIQSEIPWQLGPSRRQEGVNFIAQELESLGAVVIASTGDNFVTDESQFNFRETLDDNQIATLTAFGITDEQLDSNVIANVSGRNYYNIKSLTLNNYVSPSPENPFVSTVLDAKMTLVEPHGFKLHEDIRELSLQLGYTGINVGRILYRLDIFFSGYHPDTGQWVNYIPLDVRAGRRAKSIAYYFNITTMEAQVDHTGVTYEVNLSPSGHVAYRPEEISIEASAIFTGDISQTETFGSFLLNLQKQMDKAVAERTNNQVQRRYQFKAPPQLLAANFFAGKFADRRGLIANDPKSGSVTATGRDVNVITIVEEALKDLTLTWDAFLKTDDPQHSKPRVHWGMRFNTIMDSGPNPGTHDFSVITIQYIIEPFITYKKSRINNRAEAAQLTAQASQIARVQQMARLGMINRIYDYINTGENTEVIDIDLNLKNFYYHTLFNPTESPSSTGNLQIESASSKNNQITTTVEFIDQEGANQEGEEEDPNIGTFDESALGPACMTKLSNSPFDVIGGGLGEMPKSDFTGSVSGSDDIRRQEYQANLDDHLRNDLIVLENMQVRGDPIWLLSPYATESGNVLFTPDEAGRPQGNQSAGDRSAYVHPQSSRCILLRMHEAFQDDYMNPNRGDPKQGCNILGGFYEIHNVTSNFEGGRFTQNLEGYKLLHLNYVEGFIGLLRTGEVDTSVANFDNRVPRRNQQPNAALLQDFLTGGSGLST